MSERFTKSPLRGQFLNVKKRSKGGQEYYSKCYFEISSVVPHCTNCIMKVATISGFQFGVSSLHFLSQKVLSDCSWYTVSCSIFVPECSMFSTQQSKLCVIPTGYRDILSIVGRKDQNAAQINILLSLFDRGSFQKTVASIGIERLKCCATSLGKKATYFKCLCIFHLLMSKSSSIYPS